MKMKKMLLMVMLLVSSLTSVAQDIASIEALVDDHKRQRRVYALRSGIEEANKELHALVADTVKGYKEINFTLEKYTKSFELITLIMNSAYTAMNIYGTASFVTGRVTEIGSLLSEFYNDLLKEGNIESSDMFIYKYGEELVTGLASDVSELVKSLGDMPLYINGKVQCTTANLLLIIDNINQTLDSTRKRVARAHLKLLGYIKARLSPFWNRKIFKSRDVMTIATDAFDHWLQNGQAAF